MSGSGKGGNNRKNHKRFNDRRNDSQKYVKRSGSMGSEGLFTDPKFEKNRQSHHERPVWTEPQMPDNPITTPDCPWCGKQIQDITTAICDRESGKPVHFDCVLQRITGMEHLETNDSVCYIGGGRFGIVHYNNPPDMRDFTIKRILEWEVKDNKDEWRRPISEYFSIT